MASQVLQQTAGEEGDKTRVVDCNAENANMRMTTETMPHHFESFKIIVMATKYSIAPNGHSSVCFRSTISPQVLLSPTQHVNVKLIFEHWLNPLDGSVNLQNLRWPAIIIA
mmetsp:Transcript_18021/g.25405  ORF Transcript_18021/g.25405 Transcript_18021/m.25405 type:complete len:111 (-) Transcript_18021:203-535(-)